MPKAAFRNAANRASAVAMRPSSGPPSAAWKAKPTVPTTAKMKPTNWANFSGGTGSFSVTGPSCGAMSAANTRP